MQPTVYGGRPTRFTSLDEHSWALVRSLMWPWRASSQSTVSIPEQGYRVVTRGFDELSRRQTRVRCCIAVLSMISQMSPACVHLYLSLLFLNPALCPNDRAYNIEQRGSSASTELWLQYWFPDPFCWNLALNRTISYRTG